MRYLILFLFIVSCTSKEELPKPTYPCGMDSPNPTYFEIKQIVKTNCIECHKDYIIYDRLNERCLDSSFYRRVLIVRDMPPNAVLDTCDIVKLRRWYYNGHQPN